MLLYQDSAPKAGTCVVCDMCGDRIHDLSKGVVWFRPITAEPKKRYTAVYFAHSGRCFDQAARFLDGHIARGPLLPVLRRMSARLVRGYEIPEETYDTFEPEDAEAGGVGTEPEPDPWRLRPESVASHCLQLRLLWTAVSDWRRKHGRPDLTFEEAAGAVWTTPLVISKLIYKPEGPRHRILEAARLFRFLYEEAREAGILPLRRGRLVIG